MNRIVPLSLCIGALSGTLLGQSGPEADKDFSSTTSTEAKPWTDREFRNDPNHFQFAIVTDRTGGMRPGVFAETVGKINEMQPEFVITVGDLIPGGTRLRDEQEARRQWEEFNGYVDRFEMPFFYLPGNHDVSNGMMDRLWDEIYGVRYYSFLYKNVLFLCLNTQDGEGTRPVLGQEQIQWARQEIADHPDVRWTFVFIHQPLWVSEEGIIRNVNGERVLRKSKTGWPEIEEALSGRKHTVFAGHVHRYAKYERNDANYYTLGTTGGGSALRGEAFGEFDHITWITMGDEGPRMINLTLDGMLPDDITTEAKQRFWRELRFTENYRETFPFQDKTVTLPITNPLDTPLSGELYWILPAEDHWTVHSRRASVDLQPGESVELTFRVHHEGDVSSYFPLPRLSTHFAGPASGFHLERTLFLPLDLTEHVKRYPEEAGVCRTDAPPLIDGRLLEGPWNAPPTIERLTPRQADGYEPASTEAWLAYDDSNLYLAVRCHEPLVRDIATRETRRDGDVRDDDSVEILFDTNQDKKTFYHFIVNSNAVLYDARQDDAEWNSSAKVATMVEDGSWTIELAIPLSEIGANLETQETWGFQMARNRHDREEKRSYQWSPTFWYGNTMPTFFGRLQIR